jgi:NAD(P)-dependent dehydrogenase (short-subunit alcohol dehydrogenase family)
MADQTFAGKVAIVTGASRGIGRTIALALAERGSTIVGTARRLESSDGTGGTLRGTIDEVEKLGAKGLAVPAEIVNEQGPNYIAERAVKVFGRIDILVNNAGIYPTVSIQDTVLKDWREMLAINVTAPFLMAKAVLPQMIAQGSGNISNVSSGSALTYTENHVGYATSKAALNTFSAFLAEEVRANGIAVNAWMPGLIQSDMNGYKGAEQSTVVPSVMWMLAQTPDTFTGQVVRLREFGETWGPKA